jgi:hypothetical protein
VYELLESILYSTNRMDCKEPTALFSCPADTTLISLWDGVAGSIGELTFNESYECVTTGILIDILVVDLTNRVDDDDDIGETDLTPWFLRSRKSRRWQLWSSPQANKTPFSTVQSVYRKKAKTIIYIPV